MFFGSLAHAQLTQDSGDRTSDQSQFIEIYDVLKVPGDVTVTFKEIYPAYTPNGMGQNDNPVPQHNSWDVDRDDTQVGNSGDIPPAGARKRAYYSVTLNQIHEYEYDIKMLWNSFLFEYHNTLTRSGLFLEVSGDDNYFFRARMEVMGVVYAIKRTVADQHLLDFYRILHGRLNMYSDTRPWHDNVIDGLGVWDPGTDPNFAYNDCEQAIVDLVRTLDFSKLPSEITANEVRALLDTIHRAQANFKRECRQEWE
jgi:hypothetical protein